MTNGSVMEIVADGQPGGGTTAVLGLCEDLKRRLNRKVILVTQKDSYAFQRGGELGLDVHGFDFFRSRFDPGLRSSLKTLVETTGPALVHAHGGRAANALVGKGRSFPLIYTVHGYHFPAKNPVVRSIFRHTEARIARNVNHIIFVSEADRHIAEANRLISPRTRFSVIRNGVDPGQMGPNDAVERDDTIVFLSRLHRQKNPSLAVEMMVHLRDIPVRLVMIGGGDLEAKVRELITRLGVETSVQMLGALSREQALIHLRRARLMVFPSLWEGLPIAPMEALYFGVPVVASNIPGTDEVVRHGRNGLLVDDPTAKTLADAVRSLLSDAALWSRLSAAGIEDAFGKFSRTANSEAHIALYESVLGEKVSVA